MTKLGDALVLDLDQVELEEGRDYSIAGVYSFGRGLFARGPITASDTAYKKLHCLHVGQLVVSRLKAFEGAVAVVPPEFDGWFLSTEFPTFTCREDALDAPYLRHVCQWDAFWSMLAAKSSGIGARRERVHASTLLALELPLPPIDEQRRVAARLDHIETASENLRDRTTKASALADALAISVASRSDLDDSAKHAAGWRRTRLGSVMHPAKASVKVDPAAEYPNVGIYSFGRGLFEKPPIEGATTSATTLNRLAAGQFIYSRLFGFEGAYSHVPPQFDGYYVSDEFPAFDPDPNELDARWLATVLRSPDRWGELAGRSTGLGVRRQRVPVDAVLDYEVWLPLIADQRAIVASIERLEEASLRRQVARTRVDALLPAALNEAFAGVS